MLLQLFRDFSVVFLPIKNYKELYTKKLWGTSLICKYNLKLVGKLITLS